MPLPYTDREVLEWLIEGKHLLYHGPGGWQLGRNEIYPHCGKRLLKRGLIEVAHARGPTYDLQYQIGVTLYRISALGREALRQDAASTLGGTYAPCRSRFFGRVDEPKRRRHGPRPVVRSMTAERIEAVYDGARYVMVGGKWFNASTNIAAPLAIASKLKAHKRG